MGGTKIIESDVLNSSNVNRNFGFNIFYHNDSFIICFVKANRKKEPIILNVLSIHIFKWITLKRNRKGSIIIHLSSKIFNRYLLVVNYIENPCLFLKCSKSPWSEIERYWSITFRILVGDTILKWRLINYSKNVLISPCVISWDIRKSSININIFKIKMKQNIR